MGAFFTNVQVHTGRQSAESVRARVIEALRRLAMSAGYEEVPVDDEVVDRFVLIPPAGSEPWITVYDEATESQHTGLLTDLAEAMSAAAEGAALGILVHDSDILELRLCRNGQLEDSYSSAPDYFEKGISADQRLALTGQPEKWQDLVVPDASIDAVRAAFSADAMFAEQILTSHLAPLLGLNRNRCSRGFEYASEEPFEPGAVRLAFRSKATPAYRQRAEGPPKLDWFVRYPDEIQIQTQRRLEKIVASVRNIGGASTGLHVFIWGSALDNALVDLTAVQLRAGLDGAPVEVPLIAEELNGVGFRRAELPDCAIPAGAVPVDLADLASAVSSRRTVKASYSGVINIFVQGTAVRPGAGELHVGAAPVENFEAGIATITFRLAIVPAVEYAEGSGPPRFAPVESATSELRLRVGQSLDQLRVAVRNSGGRAGATRAGFAGTAVDQGLLSSTSARIAAEDGTRAAEADLMVIRLRTGQRHWNASFPGFEVPAGPGGIPIEVSLIGTVAIAGSGDLRVRVMPAENPGEGAAEFNIHVTVEG